MSKRGSYIGGGSVIKDPAYRNRIAARRRKTRQHDERVAFEKARFAAEMQAYEATQPKLVKSREAVS